MDTKVLETFLTVAESGGLSAAASVLGVPQSMISRRIKELESECRASLLYRHGRGVKLTAAGETLYASLRPLVEQLKSAVSCVADQDLAPSGAVTIAMSPSFMRGVGLRLLDAMRSRYPDVKVRLVSGYSRYVYEWLLQARVDIGVLSDVGMSAQLVMEDLGSASVVLTASRDFRGTGGTGGTGGAGGSGIADIGLPELLGLPLVLPSEGQGLRRHLDLWAAKQEIALNVAYEVDDIELAKELVAAGRGVAMLPRPAIHRELASGAFVERSLGPNALRVRSALATARNRPVTAAMKVTTQVLKSVAAEMFSDWG